MQVRKALYILLCCQHVLRKLVTLMQVRYGHQLAAMTGSNCPDGSANSMEALNAEDAGLKQRAVIVGVAEVVVTHRQYMLCQCMLCRLFTLLWEQPGTRENAQVHPATRSQSQQDSSETEGSKVGGVIKALRTHAPKLRTKFIVTFWCRSQNTRLLHQVSAPSHPIYRPIGLL